MTYVEEKVRQSLKNKIPATAGFIQPYASSYLELAERIVRNAVKWQDENGRIIDPYEKKETNTVTARYVGALGLQILQGRCLDLIESCSQALTPALEDLFHKKTSWGEFIAKEACMAYMALKDKVSPKLVENWKHLLADYDPELAYYSTFTNNPSALHNYCTFAIAGEAIKKKLGLADNAVFIDRYIDQQLHCFDRNGMYNDPHSPMTYDMVSRMNLTLALWAGYEGPFSKQLNEALKRGALAQLLCQSATGECPFGGRSSQQNFNEVTFALICEFEAQRWAQSGDSMMAGAFKRAALLAICSVEKYLRQSPIYFTKNLFPPETQHGRQKGYGFYGAYSLLIASQLGFAWLLADKTIEAGRCPAECGGYVFEPEKSFHKIFANSGGTNLEIDTNANFHYDSTGLGRINFIGCPAELSLSLPITATPDYLTAIPPSPENVSIGAGWNGTWLAALNGDKLHSNCNILEERQDSVKFSVEYDFESNIVSELYNISHRGIEMSVNSNPGSFLCFRIPLLKTNGRDISEIKKTDNGFEVIFQNFVYSIKCLTSDVSVSIEDFDAPNRNGIYKVGLFISKDDSLRFCFSVAREN
jgi:hypothetical protein